MIALKNSLSCKKFSKGPNTSRQIDKRRPMKKPVPFGTGFSYDCHVFLIQELS
ncbi:hypothetical protein NC99_27370 [Sunxiuqinia dokdonensis]|uniref:Uncharacterized protein n=1 Tax=Sunxiuqinia dokdonensis TaxID=1409788 RepID=A0A0L8V8H6_9BACT|nr:hypothetical protein NC99_27370 [Sunxiuqinia dokdonensis]